jgi:superfamily II DNA/RNA helicase
MSGSTNVMSADKVSADTNFVPFITGRIRYKMNSFQELQLPGELSTALARMNFTVPTPIQAQAVPVALTGRDLIASAETGSGKTAAFGIPLMARLIETPMATALVLAPTRELAVQIIHVIKDLAAALPRFQAALLIGGVPMGGQLRALSQRPRVIVATPGRLVDHIERGSVRLDQCGVLVLDEADRMLDMGFAPQLGRIRRVLPRTRQTLLFSATLPPDIEALAAEWLTEPARVAIGQVSRPVERIDQQVIETVQEAKNDVLLRELKGREGAVLIFARTKRRTDRLARTLTSAGLRVAHIHGDRSQGQRQKALEGFRDGRYSILVATDIAARGLDIPEIAHVVNYDLPMVPEDYVHRIGRTARAGRHGAALALVSPDERSMWRAIVRLMEKGAAGPIERANPARPAASARSGGAPRPQRHHRSRGPGRHGDGQRLGRGSEGFRGNDERRPRRGGGDGPRSNRGGRRFADSGYGAPAGGRSGSRPGYLDRRS